jgi:hypothetical protein
MDSRSHHRTLALTLGALLTAVLTTAAQGPDPSKVEISTIKIAVDLTGETGIFPRYPHVDLSSVTPCDETTQADVSDSFAGTVSPPSSRVFNAPPENNIS